MKLRIDGWYNADKGKHFVLTKKGKEEVASYKEKNVGEPVSEYDTEAVAWSVDKGYVEEVGIPNWIVKIGYKVVYDYKGYTLCAGNPIIFPEMELAEKYRQNYEKRHYSKQKCYISEAIYEGRALKKCAEYNGKKVYNRDWYYGTDALQIGDYVEDEIVDELINCLFPTCLRHDYFQLGEPASHCKDETGTYRATFATFKKITDNIWEYCGDCFRGENVQREELKCQLTQIKTLAEVMKI